MAERVSKIWVTVLGWLFLCPMLCFAADLSLAMGSSQGDDCVTPFDKTVTIKHQPMPFCVVMTNNSSSPESVYWKVESGAIASLSFELTPTQGDSFVVKRKRTPTHSGQVISNYLAPGASVKKTVMTDINTWENLPVIESGKAQEFKVRAVYDNTNTRVYSDYYTLILDGR